MGVISYTITIPENEPSELADTALLLMETEGVYVSYVAVGGRHQTERPNKAPFDMYVVPPVSNSRTIQMIYENQSFKVKEGDYTYLVRNLLSNHVCVMARESDFKELQFAGPHGGSVSDCGSAGKKVTLTRDDNWVYFTFS